MKPLDGLLWRGDVKASKGYVDTAAAAAASKDYAYNRWIDGISGGSTFMHALYDPHLNRGPSGTIGVGVGTPEKIWAFKWVEPRARVIDKVFVNITVAAASNWRAGIWTADNVSTGDERPVTLVKDSGNVATNPAGLKSATMSYRTTANTLYWIGITFQNSAGSTASACTAAISTNLAVHSSLSPIICISRTFTYGALPATFGTTIAGETSGVPAAWLSYSGL